MSSSVRKQYDKKTAKVKAEHYCAYQERSQQEVRRKLYEWGLRKNEVEELIGELITSNFLNEERFATAYAQGKFRMKAWGKIKIKQGLKLKDVSEACIKTALKNIEDQEYKLKLQDVINKKAKIEKEKNPIKKTYKLAAYAISRGFEQELVWNILKKED